MEGGPGAGSAGSVFRAQEDMARQREADRVKVRPHVQPGSCLSKEPEDQASGALG